jgi:hypothetical protein
VSRRSRHLTSLEAAAREAELAALWRLNQYAGGLAASVEPDDVRRVLAMLAVAMNFHPPTEGGSTVSEIVEMHRKDVEALKVEHATSLAVRREVIMATLLAGRLAQGATFAGCVNHVRDARELADAIMEAAK